MLDDILTADTVLHDLPTTELPRRVLCYEQVSSTMDTAREQIGQRSAEEFPLLVLAEEQTAGRGRMGRPWSAPAGSALLFSLVLRPHWLNPADAAALVWMTGVSLCEGIAAVTPLQPRLKWPNDVLLPDAHSGMRKVAGILLEASSTESRMDWATIGCGLNVHASPPPDSNLLYPAGDLAAALGGPLPRLPLLRAILVRLDHWYNRLHNGERDALFAIWRRLLVTPGQQVRVQTSAGEIAGLAEDVEPSGSLRIVDAAGQIHIVSNGDVSG